MPELPVQVTFRDVSASTDIEDHIRRRVRKLDMYFDRIMGCRVAVEAPLHRHRHGKRYAVRIDVTVPGNELVVGCHQARSSKEDENVYAVIDAAFDDAERVIEEYAHKLRQRR